MSAPYLQDEKKEPLPAYVEGSDSEGEVKSFSALLEEGKLQPLQFRARTALFHLNINFAQIVAFSFFRIARNLPTSIWS